MPSKFPSSGAPAKIVSAKNQHTGFLKKQRKKMALIRNAVHIAQFWTLLDEKGNLKTETLKDSGEKMPEQLLWWSKALKTTIRFLY
jgi:hypothetical protein